MNIGIVVYSHSGHTLRVAQALDEKLVEGGHQVTLTQLETVEPLRMSDTTARLRSRPPLDDCDAVVFACPVRGGTPAPPMRIYLEDLAPLEGKQVFCLVTGFFPAAWGRKQTLAQMRDLCEAKGATLLGTGSVWWTSLRRSREIATLVDHISRALVPLESYAPGD